MPVKSIELQNFKSYGGKQVIGPFKDFTSVIGPNGSGKSNLMDAISFVLGVQSRDLRSSQMKDLIFRPVGDNAARQNLRAVAALVFETADGEEIRFSRSISPAGHGDYRVNEKTVSFAEYEEALGGIGVLLKARNFLVFQGDVEALARKTPAELVEVVETIAGSYDLKEEYELALQEKEAAMKESMAFSLKQKSFKSERRLLKQQKEETEHFQTLMEAKAECQTEYYLWQLYHLDQDRIEREATVQGLEQQLVKLKETEQESAEALKEAKKESSAARRKTGQLDKKRVQLASQLDQMEPSVIQIAVEAKNLQKKLKQDEVLLSKKTADAENHATKLSSLASEANEFRQTLSSLEKDYEEIKRNAAGADSVTMTPEHEERYELVRQAAAAASVEPRRKLAKCSRELEWVRGKLANLGRDRDRANESYKEVELDVIALRGRVEQLAEVSQCSACVKRGICIRGLTLSLRLGSEH
jgi:structural maintenance of chromosome 1